jgi:polysaccharide pyruvyl transferase WcaK-like protein
MRILLDSCSYNCQNVGDLAMLTVAVSRLRELFPSGRIQVITNAPAIVQRHCGAIETVPVRGRRLLLQEQFLGRFRRLLPATLADRWGRAEDRVRRRRPDLFAASLKLKARLRGTDAADVDAFLSAIASADLVIVNGAGILNDAFQENAFGILATLDLAMDRGTPAALFGQGIGPIDDPALRRRAADVLSRVSLIAVRESHASVPLLHALGVSPSRIVVTGDDAVELAFRAAAARADASHGSKIGVNLRVAPYAHVEQNLVTTMREVLRDAARSHGARLTPVPIAHHGGRMDVETLRDLLVGVDEADARDGGANVITPRIAIDRIAECRVMVTGSYHGAVFALAQGIPVVALAKSPYYVDKMAGVGAQFGVGCEIVRLDRPDLAERIRSAIDRAWADAERLREPLLASAADQIHRSRAAYATLRSLSGAIPPLAARLVG